MNSEVPRPLAPTHSETLTCLAIKSHSSGIKRTAKCSREERGRATATAHTGNGNGNPNGAPEMVPHTNTLTQGAHKRLRLTAYTCGHGRAYKRSEY